MKYLVLVSTLLGLIVFTGCPPTPTAPNLYQKWLNSYEEETNQANERCYRPASYNFPQSRTRSGFEFNEDGTMSIFYPGPTDALVTQQGTWTRKGEQQLEVKLTNPNSNQNETFLIDITSFSDGLLKIKPPQITATGPNTSLLAKVWLNSYEDETDPANERCYRPKGFEFPRSRGRSGFEFKKDGTFIMFYPGPTDAIESKQGTWSAKGGDEVAITLNNPNPNQNKTFTMTINSLTEDVLKIKPPQITPTTKGK